MARKELQFDVRLERIDGKGYSRTRGYDFVVIQDATDDEVGELSNLDFFKGLKANIPKGKIRNATITVRF